MSDPLTTAGALDADPGEPNPHRARWVLERDLELFGLKAVPRGEGFGVSFEYLLSKLRLHARVREDSYESFACGREPGADRVFWNTEGARVGARAAAALWSELVGERAYRLGHGLSLIHDADPARVLEEAREALVRWKRECESEWRVRAQLRARAEEWKFYRQQATEERWCDEQGRPTRPHGDDGSEPRVPPSPKPGEARATLEPIAADNPRVEWARLPARRWSGLFSVQVGVSASGRTATGQFLVDSGAAASVVSPGFLRNQGIDPGSLLRRGTPVQRVSWAGGSGSARWISVSGASAGGRSLGITEFLLMDTGLFGPPQSRERCCDGILGADFFRSFAVELVPSPVAPEVRLYPREGFARYTASALGVLPSPWPWVELETSPRGELVSDCHLEATASIPEARWDTGSEQGVTVHFPWASKLKGVRGPWRLRCGGTELASGLDSGAVLAPDPAQSRPGTPFHSRSPGFTLGMEFLDRGAVAFDIAHGRIWIEPAALRVPVAINRSGISLRYVIDDETGRRLRVARLGEEAPARRLRERGVKVGQEILRVDGHPAAEFDLWTIEQKLSGRSGPTVRLEWAERDGAPRSELLKIAN